MSTIHNIKPKGTFTFSKLNLKLRELPFDVQFRNKHDNIYYYWVPDKATRGVDVTIEDDLIEVRNTILSNTNDYELTKLLIWEILAITHGKVYNEENEEVMGDVIMSKKAIEKNISGEKDVIVHFTDKGEVISVDGPVRKVHFGKRVMKELRQSNNNSIESFQLLDLICKVNYNLPIYEDGMVMEVIDKKSGEPKYMKLITGKENLIIGKYDAVLFNDEGKVVMLSNELLNTILPHEWELVDEYTIIAPILEERSWLKLLEAARALDISSEIL